MPQNTGIDRKLETGIATGLGHNGTDRTLIENTTTLGNKDMLTPGHLLFPELQEADFILFQAMFAFDGAALTKNFQDAIFKVYIGPLEGNYLVHT